jgi:hypothetical protein
MVEIDCPGDCRIVTPYCIWHNFGPFALFLAFENFLNCFKYQGMGSLYYPVGLGVVYGCEGDLHSDLVVEILEHVIVELFGIADGNISWDAVAIDDVLQEKNY